MKRVKPYWIKERHNPQLGTYYVACGQLSRTAASKMMGKSLYGYNTMQAFTTESEYKKALDSLKAEGHMVQ